MPVLLTSSGCLFWTNRPNLAFFRLSGGDQSPFLLKCYVLVPKTQVYPLHCFTFIHSQSCVHTFCVSYLELESKETGLYRWDYNRSTTNQLIVNHNKCFEIRCLGMGFRCPMVLVSMLSPLFVTLLHGGFNLLLKILCYTTWSGWVWSKNINTL